MNSIPSFSRLRFFVPVVLALCLGLVPGNRVQAQFRLSPGVLSKDHSLFLAAFRDVVEDARKSTVPIICEGKQVALGTVVSADGLVLTKASEVRENPTCKLPSGLVRAKVVAIHADYDLALLRVDARGLTPITWRDSKSVLAGSWLAAPGVGINPLGVGVVGVQTRKVTAWANPGNINPFGGFLGISTGPTEGEEGAEIVRVLPDTAAEKAKLQVGDLVLSVRGKKIKSPEEVVKALWGARPGDTIRIKVLRDAMEVEITATLLKRPALSRSEFQNSLGSELSDKRTGFPTILQHDVVIKPHQCGGPIVDLTGKAVGIDIARAGRTESYAVPSEAVLELLNAFKEGKFAYASNED
jgi:serine protease Do